MFFNYLFWVWTWNYLLKYIAVCLMYFNTVHIQIHFHEIVYTIVWRSSFKRPHNVSCWVMSRPILFKKCSWKLKCLRPYLEFRMKVSLYLAILSYFFVLIYDRQLKVKWAHQKKCTFISTLQWKHTSICTKESNANETKWRKTAWTFRCDCASIWN